jgi:hypothetical protein
VFSDGVAAKQAQKEHLARALTGAREPELDELTERVAAMVSPVVEAAVDAVLAGRSEMPEAPTPDSAPARGASFDGGARAAVPLPAPSHDEWLVTVIRQRLADRGGNF